MARVTGPSGEPPRTFSVFRLRRYLPEQVKEALRPLGWAPLWSVPYGHEVGYPRTLCLLQRG